MKRNKKLDRGLSRRFTNAHENDFEYRILTMERAESDTHEVEDMINELAEEGWRVVGYSAAVLRGVLQAGFRHLILLERPFDEGYEDEGEE